MKTLYKDRADAPNLRLVSRRSPERCGTCAHFTAGNQECDLFDFQPSPFELCDAFEPRGANKAFLQGEIAKVDPDQKLVFGWLYVCRKADGSQVVDHSGETIAIAELEKAAVGFVLNSRRGDAQHEKKGVGRLVEACCFTPQKQAAMGIPPGVVPQGLWVGFKIDDPDTWEKVKQGRFKMFSLGGRAIRRALEKMNAQGS